MFFFFFCVCYFHFTLLQVAHATLKCIVLLHSAGCHARVSEFHLQPVGCYCMLLTAECRVPSAECRQCVHIKRVRFCLATCAACFVCISALGRALHTFSSPLCICVLPDCIDACSRLGSSTLIGHANNAINLMHFYCSSLLHHCPMRHSLHLRFILLSRYHLPLRRTLLFYAPHKYEHIW